MRHSCVTVETMTGPSKLSSYQMVEALQSLRFSASRNSLGSCSNAAQLWWTCWESNPGPITETTTSYVRNLYVAYLGSRVDHGGTNRTDLSVIHFWALLRVSHIPLGATG